MRDKNLNQIVSDVRKAYKKGKLGEDQIRRLDDIGFDFIGQKARGVTLRESVADLLRTYPHEYTYSEIANIFDVDWNVCYRIIRYQGLEELVKPVRGRVNIAGLLDDYENIRDVNALAFSLECMESKSIEEVGEREEIVESTPIVTLDGTSYISGEFVGSTSLLGGNRVHGNISEDDYYTVMTADGNGGYKKKRYLASEVTVLFDSSKEDARVERVAIIKDKKVTYMSSSSLLFESPIEFPYGQECQYETRIHIPEGSWGEYQFNVN